MIWSWLPYSPSVSYADTSPWRGRIGDAFTAPPLEARPLLWKSADHMRSAGLFSAERLVLLGQLVRYGISGGIASLVNIGVYHAGVKLAHLDPNLAWTIGFLAAATTGYVIHSRWSFRGHGKRDNVWRQTSRFMIVSIVSFALNSAWVYLLVQHLKLPIWAPYPFALFVTPLLVFWLNRVWVFG